MKTEDQILKEKEEYAQQQSCEFAEWYLQNENNYYGSIKSIYNAWIEAGKTSLVAEKVVPVCDHYFPLVYSDTASPHYAPCEFCGIPHTER